ncbi:MAG: type II toxin-antitoxin system RelE/ParE family toxin [Methanobacteriota archaeon]
MFEVVIPKSTQRALKKAPGHIEGRCLELFETLQYSFVPFGYDVKKLKGYSMAFRVRLGDWRVTYEVLKMRK